MDDLRIGSFGFIDSRFDRTKDGSKKRSKQARAEPEEDPADQVTLSSAGNTEEQLTGYFPASPDEPTK